jgi:hypothetical protein
VDAVAYARGSALGSGVTVRTDSTYVPVHPITSEGRPVNFAGAVGELELLLEVVRPLDGGEGEVRLTATGEGARSMSGLPNVTVVGPADLKPSGSLDGGKSRSWSYLLSPLDSGRVVLGPDSIGWLDPETGTFRQASFGPDTLQATRPPPPGTSVAPPRRRGDVVSPVTLAGGAVFLAVLVSMVLLTRSRRRDRDIRVAEAEDPDQLLSALESELSRLLTGEEGYMDGRELARLLALRGVDRITIRAVVASWRRAEALVAGTGRHMLDEVREEADSALGRLRGLLIEDSNAENG